MYRRALRKYSYFPITKEYYNEENSALHWAVKKEMEYEDINIGSEHVEDFYKALQKDIKEGNLKEVSYLRDEKKTYEENKQLQ